jgi:hypothetical protein
MTDKKQIKIDFLYYIKEITCPWCKLKHTSLTGLNNHFFIEEEDDEEENERLKIHGGPNNNEIFIFLDMIKKRDDVIFKNLVKGAFYTKTN